MAIVVLTFKTEKVATFKVGLYQHDPYGSPFYDTRLHEAEIINKVIAGSVNRSSVITVNSAMSEVTNDVGSYYMKISVGTPPIEVIGMIDTGSDFTWIECKLPHFNLQASSSYSKVYCGHGNQCPPHSYSECETDKLCHFNISYFDGSNSNGLLSTEALRIKSTVSDHVVEIPTYLFGCSRDTKITNNMFIPGIIGLGYGPYSLVAQLGPHSKGKFSYCLFRIDLSHKVSYIYFGPRANVQSSQSVTLPLGKHNLHYHYFLTLKALTIGYFRIAFKDTSGPEDEGNFIIDTGTPVSSLPSQIYAKVRHAMKIQTKATPESYKNFDLCYKMEENVKIPRIVLHFRGGDVFLQRYNAFVGMGPVECFVFKGNDEVSVFGSLAQQDFIVEYDWNRRTVTFQPFECTDF